VICSEMFLPDDEPEHFEMRRSDVRKLSVLDTDGGIECERMRYVSQPKSLRDTDPYGV